MGAERNYLIPAAIVAAGAIIAGAILYVGWSATSRPPATPAGPGTSAGPGAAGPAEVSADDDPFLGSEDAPVTMIEFSDFECPFCGRFWKQTLPLLREQYINTGKVKFVYRDFPIASLHANAQKAAEAAECAREQGKFWQYHDVIFQNQGALGIASYKRWAGELGLDTARFNQCLDSGRYAEEVLSDFRAGQAAGASGTPTFFINGRMVVGALPFEQFQAILDAELSGRGGP